MSISASVKLVNKDSFHSSSYKLTLGFGNFLQLILIYFELIKVSHASFSEKLKLALFKFLIIALNSQNDNFLKDSSDTSCHLYFISKTSLFEVRISIFQFLKPRSLNAVIDCTYFLIQSSSKTLDNNSLSFT